MNPDDGALDEPGPIDSYLDDLAAHLAGRTVMVRRILTETEAHLREAAAAAEADGDTPHHAEVQAVARFGPAAAVARQFEGPAGRLSRSTLAELLAAAVLLCGIGLAAIGVSGALAAAMGAAFGKPFVAGDAPGVTYTRDRCAEYLEYQPHARSCTAAAVAHHFEEIVAYRGAAGLLGVTVLCGHLLLRRRRKEGAARLGGFLPEGFVATVGAALFGIAGAALLVQGLGETAGGIDHGAGANLSGAAVSLLVAVAFLVPLLRTLSKRAALLPPVDPDA